MGKKEVLLSRNHDEWLELCEWIEVNLFNYDISKNQRLHTRACCILEGLRKGQEVADNKENTYGEYPLNVIFMTFKANKLEIQNAIKNKNFKSETQKMMYICAIVRDKLNDMYSRYLNAQKIQEKVETVDTSILTNDGAEYKSTERKSNKRLESLW